uniref:Helicase ATP-binding domain-containing protein n=1 Tax=Parastrongyloides trichosuri TaxID=131310 RepID=A0A0N4ZLX9_PARTI
MPSPSTGSDKRICFEAPILGSFLYSGVSSLHAVVMLPAIQLMEQILNKFIKYTMDGISIMEASKTTDSKKEEKMLFVNDGKKIDLSHLGYLVVDEVGRMPNRAKVYLLDTIEEKSKVG